MFKSTGIIKYDPERPGMTKRVDGWCVALVDREITRYFRWWINKEVTNPLDISVLGSLKKYPFVNLCHPSWDAHISIVRGERKWVSEDKKHLWKKYHNQKFEFTYDMKPIQVRNKPDFWIVEVHSDEMMGIRKELGLRTTWPLHITVARTYIWGNKDDDY